MTQFSLTRAAIQFERLIKKGEIQLVKPESIFTITENNFTFEITICPGLLSQKPRSAQDMAAMDSLRFADPDPDFFLANIGNNHKLILNKYCTMPLQLLLCSTAYLPQLGYLDQVDLAAIWDVLYAADTPFVAMFSCGQSAGASINHKHIQFFPYTKEFKLLPEAMDDLTLESVPFLCFLGRDMPKDNSAEAKQKLEAMYTGFVQKTIDILDLNPTAIVSHNLIMTKDWMFFVPRSKPNIGRALTGAKGVVGLIWLFDEEELAAWTSSGFMNILAELGIRKSDIKKRLVADTSANEIGK